LKRIYIQEIGGSDDECEDEGKETVSPPVPKQSNNDRLACRTCLYKWINENNVLYQAVFFN